MATIGRMQNLTPEDKSQIYEAMSVAILRSFEEDEQRVRAAETGRAMKRTVGETRRRAEMLADMFRILYAERGWGMQRALGYLPRGLRMTLDGEDWEPKGDGDRKIWLAGDGE